MLSRKRSNRHGKVRLPQLIITRLHLCYRAIRTEPREQVFAYHLLGDFCAGSLRQLVGEDPESGHFIAGNLAAAVLLEGRFVQSNAGL